MFQENLIFMRRIFFIMLMLSAVFKPGLIFAQDNINNNNLKPESLQDMSLSECLNIALENHPSIRKSKSAKESAAVQLEQIKINNRMTMNVTGNLNYNGDFDDAGDGYHSEGLNLNASKLIYDTGKNKLQQKIKYQSLLGANETEFNTKITVATNARRAYYDLVLKNLNRDVEQEKLNNLEQHLITAKGLYDVGKNAFIEITKAQSDVASARVSLLKSENDILISREALRVAMGLDIDDPFKINLSTGLFLPAPVPEIDELIKIALNDRPDYKKLLHDVEGGKLSITEAARTSSPTLNGSIGSGISKREGDSSTNNYNFGLSLNIPVVDAGAKKSAVNLAKYELNQINADVDALRQNIIYSVRSAALSLKNAVDRVRSSELSVKYAQENLELARGRYEVGVGDALELSDAVSDLAEARYTYYQALYDSQSALSDLYEALGHLPEEI